MGNVPVVVTHDSVRDAYFVQGPFQLYKERISNQLPGTEVTLCEGGFLVTQGSYPRNAWAKTKKMIERITASLEMRQPRQPA